MKTKNFTAFYFCLILSSLDFYSSSPNYQTFYNEAKADEKWILETRHWLHQHPEIAFKEYETSNFIKETLKSLNVSFSENWGVNTNDPQAGAGTGVVAEMGTGFPPCVAFRADIDALPLNEYTDLPFKSVNEGKMHACGHDVHTTMLLSAIKMLKKYEAEMNGTARFIFQPAEETYGGAKMMVEEGVLTKYPPVERIYGQHVMSKFKSGTINTNPKTLQGGANSFEITITGKGGHAAMHHMSNDPIVASMSLVRSLYDVYARELYFDIEHAGVISVTYVDAGSSATNVLPDFVVIGGTFRATKQKTMEYIAKRIEEVTYQTAATYKCTATITRAPNPYPVLENTPEIFEFFKNITDEAAVDGKVTIVEPTMAAEDYAFYTTVPSLYFHLGSGSGAEKEGQPKSDYPHHSSQFAVDETIIPQGAAINAHIIYQSIKDMSKNFDESKSFSKDEL